MDDHSEIIWVLADPFGAYGDFVSGAPGGGVLFESKDEAKGLRRFPVLGGEKLGDVREPFGGERRGFIAPFLQIRSGFGINGYFGGDDGRGGWVDPLAQIGGLGLDLKQEEG